MPDIIEVANQLSVFDANLLLQKNSSLESYIYVVLPSKDGTHLDSIFRTKKGNIVWKFFPYEGYYTYEFAGNSRYQRRMNRRNDFLEYLQDKHPEDLEFFLWHPEIEENKWFRDGVIHDE